MRFRASRIPLPIFTFYPFNSIMTFKQKISPIATTLCLTPGMPLRIKYRKGMDSLVPVLRVR